MLNLRPAPKPAPIVKVKKRRKKTPRQKMEKELDALVREIVMQRDSNSIPLSYRAALNENGAIEYTINHSGVPQCGHIISRAAKPVRWDLLNCHKQDASDNLLHEYYPEVFITWFINTFGLEKWREMVLDSRKLWKYSMDDLETLYIELTEIQKRQQKNPDWKPYYSQKQIISGEWRKDVK